MFDPRNREWVRFPRLDALEADVRVGAGLDVDVSRKMHGYSSCLARHSFYDCLSIALRGPVVPGKVDHPPEPLCEPEAHDGHDPRQLWKSSYVSHSAVDPSADEDDEGKDNVDVEERLVECVSEWRDRQDENEYQRNGSNHSRRDEGFAHDPIRDGLPTSIGDLNDEPCDCVDDGFYDNQSSQPPVDEVVCVEAHLEPGDEQVVACSQKDEGNHVDHREGARSASKLGTERVHVLVVPVQHEHVDDVADDEDAEEDKVKPGRQGADVDCIRELDLAVMPFLPEGSIKNLLLEPG